MVDCKNPLADPPRAQRILLIRLGALGDVVRTLPALSSLRAHYRDAHIAWLVEPAAAGVLVGQPALDAVRVFPREELEGLLRAGRLGSLVRRVSEIVRGLRAERFDLVLDFHSILKSGVLSRLSGAPVRVAYARPFGREASWLFANRRARLQPDRISRFERNAGLLRFLGVAADQDPGLEVRPSPLHLDPDTVERVAAAIAERGAFAVLHPGSSESTPYKRYGVAAYGRLARELKARTGLSCLVSAGPGESEGKAARSVVEASDGAARLAPPTADLRELAALYAHCEIFVGSDSGPLHLAALAGAPVLQLMGPTDPVENTPWEGALWRRARVPLACSPCRRGCAAAPCMRVLPARWVLDAALALLAESRAKQAMSAAAPRENAADAATVREPRRATGAKR